MAVLPIAGEVNFAIRLSHEARCVDGVKPYPLILNE
jgi:hypothetical protein